MTCTRLVAHREMKDQLSAVIAANAAGVLGYIPEIRWQGVAEPAEPDVAKYWLRFSIQTVMEEQASIGSPFAANKAMYNTAGLLFVQCFGPMSDAQAWAKLNLLVGVVRDAYRGKKTASDVWFRNVRFRELDPDKQRQRINVVAEFEYNEVA